jgi:hypothetical protein
MNLSPLGELTLAVEVTNLSPHGFWILIEDQEFFLSYEDFPWFQDVPLKDIFYVEKLTPHHLYWPNLDIDLNLESIKHPEQFPLKAKSPIAR